MPANPPPPGESQRFITIVIGVLVGLIVVIATVATATLASAAPCSVNYQVLKQSSKHYRASVELINNSDAVDAWTLEFDLPEGQTVRRGWNGRFSQSGASVTVEGGSLATDQTVSPQFTARRSGAIKAPSSFTLNGEVCDDGSGTTGTTEAPTTTEEPTTTEAPTTTEEPTTTEAPTTTEEPTTTEAPTTTEEPTTTTTEDTTTTTDGGGGSSAEANLALIKANPTRNTQFDNNRYRDVPMADIPLSGLTVNGDIYNEGHIDTTYSGYFRVECEISHFAYDDPIVHPNKPGMAHLHMFFGNTDANAYSTFDSLMNTGTGTCNGEDLNRSAYWTPALLDRDGNALIPFEVMVYYKNDNFLYGGANELVEPFPDDLQMIAGRASATSPQNDLTGGPGSLPVVGFVCGPAYQGGDLSPIIPDCDGTGADPYRGRALEMRIAFPQCYDPNKGTYLADGSHMAYSEGGYYGIRCPDSHPFDVSSIMYRIFFDPEQYGGSLRDLHLSSDVKHDRILPGGTTVHADWFGAWHPEAMRMWVDNCNNTPVDCEVGLLDRDPEISMVDRKKGFYPGGYRAKAEDLIKLCPGKELNPNDRLRSVAMCRHGNHG